MKKTITLLALVAGFVSFLGTARATLYIYNITYSGASRSNTATAFGTITLEDPPNPGSSSDFSKVISLTLTVSGASSGNGTFTKSDFIGWSWATNGGTLDLDAELVGQDTLDLPWGTDIFEGGAGDFQLFAAQGSGAPNGTWLFQQTTSEGSGDPMFLTSMSPESLAAPEPSQVAASLLALSGLGIYLWRRKNTAQASRLRS
jgi:hypothetical protein